jgi:hypothetical protein
MDEKRHPTFSPERMMEDDTDDRGLAGGRIVGVEEVAEDEKFVFQVRRLLAQKVGSHFFGGEE